MSGRREARLPRRDNPISVCLRYELINLEGRVYVLKGYKAEGLRSGGLRIADLRKLESVHLFQYAIRNPKSAIIAEVRRGVCLPAAVGGVGVDTISGAAQWRVQLNV